MEPTCKCFTCRNRDKPELLMAYYEGYIEACNAILLWAKRNNIKAGSIADDDIHGLVARVEFDRDESLYLLHETKKHITVHSTKEA